MNAKKPNNRTNKQAIDDLEIPSVPSSSGPQSVGSKIAGYSSLSEKPVDLPVVIPIQGSMQHAGSVTEEDEAWSRLIPSRVSILSVNLKHDPDPIFKSQARLPIEDRKPIICLDARRSSAKDLYDWVERFVLNLYAQPEQPPETAFEPLLVVVCNAGTSTDEFSSWLDVHIVAVNEDSSDEAVEVYRAHLLRTIRAFVAQSPRQDDLIPDGLTSVDAEQRQTPEEIKAARRDSEIVERIEKRKH